MRDLILGFVAVSAALSLGLNLYLLRARLLDRRRAIAAHTAILQMRLGGADPPDQKQRRHLRAVPVFLGVATTAAGAAWLKAHQVPAAVIAGGVAAAATAVLVTTTTPEPVPSISASPAYTTTTSRELSTPGGTSTSTASPSTTDVSQEDRVTSERSAPGTPPDRTRAPVPPTTATSGSPSLSTPEDPGDDLDETGPVDCLVHIESLGVVDICLPVLLSAA